MVLYWSPLLEVAQQKQMSYAVAVGAYCIASLSNSFSCRKTNTEETVKSQEKHVNSCASHGLFGNGITQLWHVYVHLHACVWKQHNVWQRLKTQSLMLSLTWLQGHLLSNHQKQPSQVTKLKVMKLCQQLWVGVVKLNSQIHRSEASLRMESIK